MRDRRGRARQGDRQPLVPGVVRPSQRLDARHDVRRLRPAGQGSLALPPLRRDRLDLARPRPVSPRRRRRAARERLRVPDHAARGAHRREHEPRSRARRARDLHSGREPVGRISVGGCRRDVRRSGRRERRRARPGEARVRRRGGGRSGRVPDLRAHDVPQLVLAGCALPSRPRRLRGVPGGLGLERRRVGVLGRARRGSTRRVRGVAPRRARRGRGDDVGLAGSERDRLGDCRSRAVVGRGS